MRLFLSLIFIDLTVRNDDNDVNDGNNRNGRNNKIGTDEYTHGN